MKQGTTKTVSAATKIEPKPRAVSPGAVSDIGQRVDRTAPKPLFEGRGLKAPMMGATSHPRGSQGTH